MTTPDTKAIDLDESNLTAPMHDAARTLLTAGYNIYVYLSQRASQRAVTWLIIEREGHLGTISHDSIRGYSTGFAIKPSTEIGSSLLVIGSSDQETQHTLDEVLETAALATSATYSNFATPGRALPNHGWAHFTWALSNLHKIRAPHTSEEN